MRTIRIASYNARAFKDDRAALARVVRAIDPDVLCLQEVPRGPFVGHRVAGFAAECDLVWSGRAGRSGQTTILTSMRVDVLEARHHALKVVSRLDTRGFAVLRVAAPGYRPVNVASVHLSLDEDERERHAHTILETLGDIDQIVLAGDLNEKEGGRAWSYLAQPLRVVSPRIPTFPARAPRSAIDVVFASPSIRVRPHVEIDLPTADLVAATDHRPIWIDIELDALTPREEAVGEVVEEIAQDAGAPDLSQN
ncbi:endonuclease/exonuclease/phosphatase family protein [Janibacter sp. G56]|uniref:endonuclease/exonuclease/phosphatase family protein n=1 Tax=Janibacter sp. G56 TaxID=3418717 RepID=UPI003D04C174